MMGLQNYQKGDAELIPDDVIAGILGFLDPPEKTTYLEGSIRLIQEAIFDLREKHPILQVFAFSRVGAYPFSRHLERVLSRLQVVRILTMDSPDFRYLIVSGRAKQVVRERVHSRFNNEGLSELREIAKEFADRCGASSEQE